MRETKPYLVWCPDEGETREDAGTIVSHSPSDAAEQKAGEDYSDGSLHGGESMCIMVECPDGSVIEFDVEAEVEVSFWAHLVTRKAQIPLDNPEVKA
jgi:hypothetical protein